MKTELLMARVEPQHLEKIDRIVKATGLNRSQVFRRLVEAARVTPSAFAVELSGQNNSSAVSSQAGSAAVVSVQ